MFASAAPTLKKRSGNRLPNLIDWVETARSASSATTSSCCSPSSVSASPYAWRVAIGSVFGARADTALPLAPRPAGGLQGAGLRVELPHQLLQRLRRLLGAWRLAVKAEPILHRGDALALLRLGDDRRGLSERAAALQRLHDLLHVVAIDLDRVPAERLELGADVDD